MLTFPTMRPLLTAAACLLILSGCFGGDTAQKNETDHAASNVPKIADGNLPNPGAGTGGTQTPSIVPPTDRPTDSFGVQ